MSVELAAETPPLVVLRERSTNGPPEGFEPRFDGDPRLAPEFFCKQPARGVGWLYSDGSVAFVRCGAPNRCDYCAMLTACENALLLARHGAAAGGFARVGITTTTSVAGASLGGLRAAEQLLWKQLRREHGRNVEYCGFLEWTTGRFNPARLPHLHHLVKGIAYEPADVVHVVNKWGERVPTLPGFEARVSELWRTFTSSTQRAAAWRVEARPLFTPAGATRYLVLHHHKREQGPPPGTKHAKRFRPSRGFFARPLGELRAEVRALLRDERIYSELVRVLDTPNAVPLALLEDWIEERFEAAQAESRAYAPEFVHVREKPCLDRATGELRYEFKEVLGLARERHRDRV